MINSFILALAAFSSLAKGVPVTRRDERGGAVVSNYAECSDIGINAIKRGGSAADAAVASVICMGLLGPQSSGIGGGGFLLARNQREDGDKYEMIDFRETAPAAANETMYVDDPTKSTIGGLAVGVPGELRGLQKLHEKYGRLEWATLFEPTVELARNGFTYDRDVNATTGGPGFILNSTLWSEVYAPNGTVAVTGQTLYNRRLAKTLETIAKEGPDAFYKGSIAENIVKAARAEGGIITLEDLANYSVIVRNPANITYRDQRVFATTTPSSGTVLLLALKVFEGYPGNITEEIDPAAYDLGIHRLIQATRFGYAARSDFGDPSFVSNASSIERDVLLPDNIARIRSLITDNSTQQPSYYQTSNYLNKFSGGTQSLSVVDGDGNAVSLTTTVNLEFGSHVITEDGIILNNEMDDFSCSVNAFGFVASPANFIRPGKRPQSSICTTITEDGRTGDLRIVTGTAGGSRIITTTLQNVRSSIDFGLTPAESQARGRWHDQLSNVTLVDVGNAELGVQGFSNRTASFLTSLNYNMTFGNVPSRATLAIRDKDGELSGAGDPRQAAAGASFA